MTISRRAMLASAALPLCASPAQSAGSSAVAARILSVDTISRHPHLYHAWPTMIRRKSGEIVAVYSGGREGIIVPLAAWR